MRPSTATTAPKISCDVETGRMTEHRGSFLLMKGHGSGMIKLFRKSRPTESLVRSGKVSPLVGSVRGGALPETSPLPNPAPPAERRRTRLDQDCGHRRGIASTNWFQW